MIRYGRPAWARSCRRWRYWAGPSAATCASKSGGPRPMPAKSVDMRPSWPRSHQTSSWRAAIRLRGHCCRRRAPCRSCSRLPPTRSVTATSTTWRGRAAMPPVSCRTNSALARTKWLELLKEIAPAVTRVAVLRDTTQGFTISMFAAIQAVAPSLRVEVIPVNLRDAGEIEQSVETFARSPNGGLIPTPSGAALHHRDLIVKLAARYRLPAIYWDSFFAAAGGLLSYGPDYVNQFRQAAGYVDRILKREKPADLPVQAPTKYELVINLKTAKALGLEVPANLLALADEVIE